MPDAEFNLPQSKLALLKKHFKELVYYPIQWFIITLIAIVWLLLTFFIEVDYCAPGK